jgi:hypothetical protein
MKVRRFAMNLHYFVVALVLVGSAAAQSGATQTSATDQKVQAGTLLQVVRDATERYKDVAAAEADGFVLTFGCVQGPDAGAMGMHFLNTARLNTNLDPTKPQIVIYEPMPDGKLKLIGADFLVFASDWDKAHPGNPPQLMGQLFQFFDSPNRFGLPAFYTLHVWAWKQNPNGAFVNWHPHVSCQAFTGQTP